MDRLVLTAVFSLLLHGAASAIDLTLRYVTTYTDGIPVRRPCFIDGDKKYAVTLDSQTELVAAEGSTLFNFTKFPRALMQLRQSPMKADVTFEPLNLPRYRAAALQLLPQGAQNPVLIAEASNVLPVNKWISQRLTFSYESGGSPMCESVLFLNLDPATQIVVQIRAGAPDFPTVTARGDDIIRRWHEVLPEAERSAN
ncbi:MAG: hypothetical protein JWL59_4535 [Chthoniobacteraceae bacterium]|nr:hypothetical protein [Chthoniobacteraceae bacterium]